VVTAQSAELPDLLNRDTEIRTATEDRLGRASFAARVADRIAAAGDGPSVVFGLAGPWGSGKTSVLNMTDEALRGKHKKRWSVVRFTPWSASDVEALTHEFYNAIASAMPSNTAKGKKAAQLLTMAPVAAAAGKALAVAAIESKIGKGAIRDAAEAATGAAADQAGKFRLKPDPFAEQFSKLSTAIVEAGRNILVIVDDVDRLDAQELLTVLKAVRLLGRFNRVHYLLAYDEQTVLAVLQQSSIAQSDPTRARQYLEKIVQYPFVLPPLQTDQVEHSLAIALQDVAAAHSIPLTPSDGGKWGTIARIVDTIPDDDLRNLTLRAINRIASQVDVLLTLVGPHEIDFGDATILTFLRLSYPELYEQLSRWRKELTGRGRAYATYSGSRQLSRGDWAVRVADTLGVAPNNRDSNSRLDGVVRLLGRLFPLTIQQWPGDENAVGRIYHEDYFGRFFAFGIPSDDVPDIRVREELAALVQTGELPSESVILAKLDDFLGRGRVLRKVLPNLEVIADLPEPRAADAAHYLNRQLGEGDRLYGGWAKVLYALLGHAVCSAENAETGKQTMDRFEAEFGLLTTAEVLAHKVDLSSVDHAKVDAASGSQRARILRLCEQDLVADVLAEDEKALTTMHFLRCLNETLAAELSQIARGLIANGKAAPHDLAARFVILRPGRRDGLPPESSHYFEWFETLVPRDLWSLEDIPPYSDADVVAGDGSLQNRVRYAAVIMRQMLQPE